MVALELLAAMQCVEYIILQTENEYNIPFGIPCHKIIENSDFYHDVVNDVLFKLVGSNWVSINNGKYYIPSSLKDKTLYDLKSIVVSPQKRSNLRRSNGVKIVELEELLNNNNDELLKQIKILNFLNIND